MSLKEQAHTKLLVLKWEFWANTLVKILVVLCLTSLKCPSLNFFSHTQSPCKDQNDFNCVKLKRHVVFNK